MMPASAPVAGLLSGPVLPRIFTGYRQRFPTGLVWTNRCSGWSCWRLHDGVADLTVGTGHPLRIRGPASLILTPDRPVVLAVQPGALVDAVSFDLVPRPGFAAYGRSMPVLDGWRPPATAAVLGCDLPLHPPAMLAGDFLAVVRFCADHWWRSETWAWRCAMRLGGWLAEAVQGLRDGPRAADPSAIEGSRRVADCARARGISRQALTRRIRASAGRPPGQLLRERRLAEAADLLVRGDRPVAAIARQCGYSSARTFAPAFRARYGASPSAYRAAQRSG